MTPNPEDTMTELVDALKRIAEATPFSTNSPTATSMSNWTKAVASEALARYEREATGRGEARLHIIFDGPPSHESGRFVEVNDDTGKSVNAGEWVERPDGLWELIIDRYAPALSLDPGVVERVEKGLADHLPLTFSNQEDYAEIYDKHGEKVALSVKPWLIMVLNEIPALLSYCQSGRGR